MTSRLTDIFSTQGAFSTVIPGYRERAQQIEMATAIASAMAANEVFIAEAGTGTGKTFAYLVPAFLSGGKVIVSTGTKNLQDQLYLRDIPTVAKALSMPLQVALLKGRANYVCHYYLERALSEGRFLTREDAADVHKIQRFAKQTQTGDKSECSGVPENSAVWNSVVSTRENCLGQDCEHHANCFVIAARRKAMDADIVVVNHHLFFADVMLRDEGVAELLPACNAVVFDEAHQLPETASLFFGHNVSTGEVLDLCRDARVEGLSAARDCLDLPNVCLRVEKSAKDLRLTLPVDPARFSKKALDARGGFEPALFGLLRDLESLAALLETQAERSEGLENCFRRATELKQSFEAWASGQRTDDVLWGETYTYALQLNATPLVIADIMKKQMEGHPRAWIFTSATLAVQKDFSHYRAEMGLHEATSAVWESPFNYPEQALLYVPTGMPEPNAFEYTEALVRAAFPLVKASHGRAFFLCTSLRAMYRVRELLDAALSDAGLKLPLLMQGEASKNTLLERFRDLGNAILVGSQSFWEGVDVRGEALSLVVIDKLPFAPPDDPVLSARIERLKELGQNAFMEYQLPRAVISVKQGAGRLIRDEADRGVLMIGDPRLVTRHYGKKIWQSLPPMKRTRELPEALAFFEV